MRLLAKSDTIQETKHMCHTYGQKALQCLEVFKPSDAKDALHNIVYATTKFSWHTKINQEL